MLGVWQKKSSQNRILTGFLSGFHGLGTRQQSCGRHERDSELVALRFCNYGCVSKRVTWRSYRSSYGTLMPKNLRMLNVYRSVMSYKTQWKCLFSHRDLRRSAVWPGEGVQDEGRTSSVHLLPGLLQRLQKARCLWE